MCPPEIALLKTFVHYFLHLAFPALIAFVFYRDQ